MLVRKLTPEDAAGFVRRARAPASEHRRGPVAPRALVHAASAFGVRQVNLGVNAKNTAAMVLYRSLGFEQFGLERDFLLIDGKYHDEGQMVCRVSGPA